jgi:uncharacterized membrane protein
VLVSVFERRVEIVADTGFDGRVADSDGTTSSAG